MPSKRKNNRKKSTKRSAPSSATPTDTVSSVAATSQLSPAPANDTIAVDSNVTALPDFIQASIDNAVGSRAVDIDSIIADVTSANITNTNEPVNMTDSTTLPDFIQMSIDSAVGSRAIDIDSIISAISRNTSDASPDTTVAANKSANSSVKEPNSETVNTTISTPLPDFIQASIDSAVGSRVVDIVGIVSSISNKVACDDYNDEQAKHKESSKGIPPATTATVIGSQAVTADSAKSNERTGPSQLSNAVEYGIETVVKSAVVDAYAISHATRSEITSKDQETAVKPAEQEPANNKPNNVQKTNQKQASSKPPQADAPTTPPKTEKNVHKKHKSSEHKKLGTHKKKDCIIL